MTLRPRYSLLILTALVAGRVKLWYGPHHMVEREDSIWEKEYSYTRDWRGNRVIHGAMVGRRFEGKKLASIAVSYYRHGVDSRWVYLCMIKDVGNANWFLFLDGRNCPLSDQELQGFRQARDTELQRLIAAGLEYESEREGTWPY